MEEEKKPDEHSKEGGSDLVLSDHLLSNPLFDDPLSGMGSGRVSKRAMGKMQRQRVSMVLVTEAF